MLEVAVWIFGFHGAAAFNFCEAVACFMVGGTNSTFEWGFVFVFMMPEALAFKVMSFVGAKIAQVDF